MCANRNETNSSIKVGATKGNMIGDVPLEGLAHCLVILLFYIVNSQIQEMSNFQQNLLELERTQQSIKKQYVVILKEDNHNTVRLTQSYLFVLNIVTKKRSLVFVNDWIRLNLIRQTIAWPPLIHQCHQPHHHPSVTLHHIKPSRLTLGLDLTTLVV